MNSIQPIFLLFALIVALSGCKTSEPVNLKALEKVQEKVLAIESYGTEEIGKNEPELKKKETSVLAKSYTSGYQLGNRMVNLDFWKKGKGLTLVNLHDNENTSVEAALALVDSLGGRILQLKHTGERNIQFTLAATNFEIDPNRIFTDTGTKATLIRYSQFSENAHREVRTLARQIVDSLDRHMIVTLHNNSEDNYSSLSYLDEYKTDAAAVYINPNRDPDDFFFVTTRDLFDQFKKLGYNTVLQNNETMTDDGSLSVLAGHQDIPYINVEAQHGHLKEQIEMLFVLVKVLEK